MEDKAVRLFRWNVRSHVAWTEWDRYESYIANDLNFAAGEKFYLKPKQTVTLTIAWDVSVCHSPEQDAVDVLFGCQNPPGSVEKHQQGNCNCGHLCYCPEVERSTLPAVDETLDRE